MLSCVLSGRVSKTYLKKSDKRTALADLIKQRGVVSETMPCSCCFKSNCACRFVPESLRCRECVYVGKSCNGNTVAASCRCSSTGSCYFLLILFLVKRLLSKQERLEKEEIDAKEELFLLQTKLQTAVGRLARLHRQKRQAKERSSELFRCSIQLLDKEDAEHRR